MKKFIKFLILVAILALVYTHRNEINTFYLTHFSKENKNVDLKYKNDYSRDFSYNYVKKTNDFIAKDKNHLINIYYTVIDSGIDTFSFYCSSTYKECINDVSTIANSQVTLSNINSFVHPFNSFSSVETKYDTLGKVTLKINKAYTKNQILEINEKMDDIIKNQIKDETDKKEIIKIVHDYIINNSKYDSDKSDKNISNYQSNIAYGPLLQGYGLCGGYTDSMALFLDYYKIPNFKVISENHIWNAVYLNGKWYHLDLTWDDPVVSNGSNVLEYNFFLISNKELKELKTNQHIYDEQVFSEVVN